MWVTTSLAGWPSRRGAGQGQLYPGVVENSDDTPGALSVTAGRQGQVDRFSLAENKVGGGACGRATEDLREKRFCCPSAVLVKDTRLAVGAYHPSLPDKVTDLFGRGGRKGDRARQDQ